MKAELRFAVAHLKRHPGFVLGTTMSLAIGMSLATAVFSVVDAALLRPLPFAEPDRLVHLTETIPIGDMSRIPPRHLLAVRSDAKAISDVAAWTGQSVVLGRSGEARSMSAVRVTSNFFRVLGVRAVLGRTFGADDGRTHEELVIIGHSLWKTRFGSEPDIVGRAIPINGRQYTIAGVMPAGFDFPHGARLWLPLPDETVLRDADTRDDDWSPYYTFGRLAPGATLQRANVEVSTIYRRLYSANPGRSGRTSRVISLAEYLTWQFREQLQVWIAAAILVMILCAVNFATMSLARGMRRRGEIAVRAAMGASAMRIVRLLVAEALLIAVIGGGLSVLLAWWLLSFTELWFAHGALPIAPSVRWTTMAFGVGATTLVGFIFGLFPALDLAKVDLRSMLQGDATATTSRRRDLRGRKALVALQLCLALTGVAVVTALLQADRRYQAFGPGFDYSPLLLAELQVFDTTARDVNVKPLLERLRGTPFINNAAAVVAVSQITVWTEQSWDGFRSMIRDVSASYFATLDVKPLAGRLPLPEEIAARAPVGIASRYLARFAFGSEQRAVGQRLRVKQPQKPSEWITIVGVVPDIGSRGLGVLSSSLYTMQERPLRQWGTVAVRVSGDPQYRVKELSQALTSFDSRLMVTDLRTARNVVDREHGATRGRTIFLGSVAVLAFLLAVIGVYGLTAYTAELRARELGIRIALGASRSRVARTVFGDLWWMAGIGIGVGVVASSKLTLFLDALLRNPMMKAPLVTLQVTPTVASAVTLLVITVLGTSVPLRRVLRMDVMRAVQGGAN